MGGFHIGFGGSPGAAADVLSTSLRTTQALRQAALQQQQYQDQQRQRSYENTIQLMQQGGTPFEPYGAAEGTGPSTSSVPGKSLIPRNQAQAPPGPGTVVQEPISGKSYYMPTPAERKKSKEAPLDDTNSVVPQGSLGEALEGAGWKPGQRIKPTEAHSLLQSLDLVAGKNANEVHYEHDEDGTTHVFVTDKKAQTSKEIATFPGTAKGTADKPDQTQFVDKGYNQPMVFNKKTQSLTAVPLPAGVKPALSPEQEQIKARADERGEDRRQAHDDREQDRRTAADEGLHKAHDALMDKAQGQHALREEYGTALATPDGQAFVNPVTKAQGPMTPEMRKYIQAKYEAATQKVTEYEGQAKQIRQRKGWGEFGQSQQQQPAAAAAAPAAQPAPEAAQPAPAAKAKQAPIAEGQIVVNRTTGERRMLKGGQWVPAPSAP